MYYFAASECTTKCIKVHSTDNLIVVSLFEPLKFIMCTPLVLWQFRRQNEQYSSPFIPMSRILTIAQYFLLLDVVGPTSSKHCPYFQIRSGWSLSGLIFNISQYTSIDGVRFWYEVTCSRWLSMRAPWQPSWTYAAYAPSSGGQTPAARWGICSSVRRLSASVTSLALQFLIHLWHAIPSDLSNCLLSSLHLLTCIRNV